MSIEQIKIVQNILIKNNKQDLAVRLENAYIEYEEVKYNYYSDGYTPVDIYIFIHPNHYIELQALNEDSKKLLKQIIAGLIPKNCSIDSLQFAINQNIIMHDISNTTYIFVDEAGDMDFSEKGSKHYMFSFLVKKRPFILHEYISNYRYKLLERNLDPLNDKRLNIEAFHAHKDNKHIKNKLFSIISTFDTNNIQVYSYILEKPKVLPEKRDEKDKFYIENLKFAIEKLLKKLSIKNDFIIITDNLPVLSNKNNQIKALKEGIGEFIKTDKHKIRYDIFHHCSASSVNLQIIDYICWAIFRKYEIQDSSYYEIINKYIIAEENMTKDRKIEFYKK